MTDAVSVVVAGAGGRMGRETVDAVSAAPDLRLAGQAHRGDDLGALLVAARPAVLVDFTVPEAVLGNTHTALAHSVVPVIGATGLGPDDILQIQAWCQACRTGAIVAPNFAIGAVLMMRFAEQAAQHFPDAEIIEMHHERKLDAPSGTAAKTAEMITRGRADALPVALPPGAFEKVPGARGGRAAGDVPVHSVRLPGFVASQMVIFGGPGQTLTLRHDSVDRKSFMPGVLLAVRRAPSLQGVGELIYGLEHLL